MQAFPDSYLTVVPAETGRVAHTLYGANGAFRLPTDPLGFATVTFDGVNANSEIRVFRTSTGAELAGVELCDADHVLVFPVYASPSNVTIRIVNVLYRTQEFTLNVNQGTFGIPIQQRLDPWYKNPA